MMMMMMMMLLQQVIYPNEIHRSYHFLHDSARKKRTFRCEISELESIASVRDYVWKFSLFSSTCCSVSSLVVVWMMMWLGDLICCLGQRIHLTFPAAKILLDRWLWMLMISWSIEFSPHHKMGGVLWRYYCRNGIIYFICQRLKRYFGWGTAKNLA